MQVGIQTNTPLIYSKLSVTLVPGNFLVHTLHDKCTLTYFEYDLHEERESYTTVIKGMVYYMENTG